MLRHLHVRNLAVLAEATVELGAGLNVVTGETGAGKSLVVDSLALLAGARSSTDLIRTGADMLTVSGLFQPAGGDWREVLERAGVEAAGDELVIRRQISRSGRHRVFINDQPVTLRLLSEIAPALIRIHGQREELGLTAPDLQRAWLDRQGGEEGRRLLKRCADAYADWRARAERLERLLGNDRLRQERIDLLRYQRGEIESAEIEAGEERRLREEREVLRNSESIVAALGNAVELIAEEEGAATERLARARHALEEIERWEREAEGWQQELDELRIRLDELARTLGQRLRQIDAEPERLNAIEDRLALLERLLRKYGGSSEEILDYEQRIAAELDELEMDASQRESLEAEVAAALADYRAAALELRRCRRVWGDGLVGHVERELADLGLRKARFAVRLELESRRDSALEIDGEPVACGPHGVDRVVFDFSPNPGEEPRPLARIASGGELSRVYLALQVVAHGTGGASGATLVFDEVDAGVGGVEAAMVGRKLRRVAEGGQLLAVTHLPQVASFGDAHFRLDKRVVRERTEVRVKELGPRHRIEELARMLAGEKVTPTSRSHAEELLAAAREGVAS